MTDRLLEVARFTPREGRCGLCGSDALTAVVGGVRCECGAISLRPRRRRPVDLEREAITREDADHLLDLLAAEGNGIDRSMGR